jgi:hypothetical protein
MPATEFYTSIFYIIMALLQWPDIGPNDPYGKYIKNIYLATLTTILLTTVGAYPGEALSLRYSPFMLVPAIHLLASFYHNNTSSRAAAKAKE